MRALYLVSVWFHIMAAAVWVGGMLFLVLVLVPAVRGPEYRHLSAGLVRVTGMRFRTVGWVCLGLLVLTGTINLLYRGIGWPALWSGELWQGSFGRTLGIKLLMVSLILLLSSLHDFWIGPRASDALLGNPASADAARLRRQASWFGRLNLLLSLVVVALGIMLVRGAPW